MDKRPIGIFDSGIGGLTVANAIQKALPEEELIYFGDTAHLPYGEKSGDAIRYFSLRICNYLLAKNCKSIVVACNSASTTAKNVIEEFFGNQAIIVNVVDPLVDFVRQRSFKKVGIIATKATIDSGVYQNMITEGGSESTTVVAQATPLLVPMIEEGYMDNEVSRAILKEYLQNEQFKNLDVLLLACTHYPLIKTPIAAFLPDTLILDSTEVAAQSLKKKLTEADLLKVKRENENQFIISDFTSTFETSAQYFFGSKIQLKMDNIWS